MVIIVYLMNMILSFQKVTCGCDVMPCDVKNQNDVKEQNERSWMPWALRTITIRKNEKPTL